ncbi:hypothetical protein SEVIR_3G024950v4 [Setaria viridis]|uniref:Secreted protein n=1 Tax=Setaria viridis TaxID=4556 RepID=A0A4U6VIH9_SETVI|nr:hypothetical protein SEVIR_3G024950v2 [Setaria viridis]
MRNHSWLCTIFVLPFLSVFSLFCMENCAASVFFAEQILHVRCHHQTFSLFLAVLQMHDCSVFLVSER